MTEAIMKGTNEWESWASIYDQSFRDPSANLDLEKMYSGYDASTDFPGLGILKQFIDYYPDAKVVLWKTRDADSWYASVKETIYQFAYGIPAENMPKPLADVGLYPVTLLET
jgi:hypothetical protein